ncbi:Qat anti-phage system associated protein QatB [uncultured Limimaricola sp.]|uniref:Qat anti-phage system associated protein QatB n=1 Tax=uncultured Limimaricola sp. TaxID=2211667 RepID=UPI0030FCAC50
MDGGDGPDVQAGEVDPGENSHHGQEAEDGATEAGPAFPPQTGGFAYPRGQFTRFTNGGGDKSLGRALRGYVRGAGGGAGAARRMPGSTRMASGVAALASAVATEGAEAALARFDLQDLAGRPAAEVLEAVADMICPDGGTIDESIARDAMLEAIADLADSDPGAFDDLSADQLNDFLCDVIARSILTKVLNEIGTNALHGSASDADFREAEQITRDYTQGRVRDALSNRFDIGARSTQAEIDRTIGDVYAETFDMLEAVLETM